MSDGFYLGGIIDPATGERTDELATYDPADLTTHGVIVGMTGSGKTGLGIIYLEESLLAGIPTLIVDPKGDMTNLLLTFPDLLPTDFEPWVDEGEARKEDKTVAELAADTAALWTKGLGRWDQDGARIAELKDRADFAIYTPGSSAGIPVNIIGSLTNPGLSWDTEAETLRDEIQGFVSGLLGLVDIEADPISSREHILLSNLVENAWQNGEDLDLATLLARVQKPPMRKLGVFEVEKFFPKKDRMALAMKLNGLIASPAFASWMEGAPLDIQQMLWSDTDKPQASIIYLAHLSEEERQFVVTLLLSKVVTWMRRQAGTGHLRALVYMDEVFGFVPPTAQPPAKKPILTMLKQGRAFGVGLLLSTQNPVDLDYRAMSNAGTWCIGRLQTERDKARIVEALQSARGDTDVAALDATISGLDKRQFLLHNTREPAPALFTTRWALSYLRGPLTREQVSTLMQDHRPAPSAPIAPSAAEPTSTPPVLELAADEMSVMPEVADGVRVAHLDPAAVWGRRAGADPTSTRLSAAVAARVHMVYDDAAAKLSHQEEWEAIYSPLSGPLDPERFVAVDYDDRDFRREGPADATYVITDSRIDTKTFFSRARTAIKNHLDRQRRLTVFKNAGLKLYSRVGESEEAFLSRCDDVAQQRADEEAAKLRDKFEAKMDRLRKRFDSADRKVGELEADLAGANQDQLIDSAGALIGILTGRRSTRSITGSSRSRASRRSKEERLRSAQAKATDVWQDMADLEQDLIEELEEINDRWEDLAAEIEPFEVGLEKDDIQVDDITLVWIPT